jgi:PPP family 3-phenylpropionic acid transporter
VGAGGYGSVRLWGSVGFIVAALLVGALLDHRPAVPLWVGAASMAGLAVVTWTLPERQSAAPPTGPRLDLRAAGRLLTQPLLLSLCVVAALHRGTICFYDQFYALHTTDVLGLPGWVPGLSIGVGVAVEVGVLAGSRRLLDRFGPTNLVVFAVVSQIPRWLLTATLTSGGGLIATQVLHGVGFGCWWVGSVALVARHAPEGLRTTAQGVFFAAGHGVGSFLALGLAAVLLDGAGTGTAFAILAGASTVALACAILWLVPAVARAEAALP